MAHSFPVAALLPLVFLAACRSSDDSAPDALDVVKEVSVAIAFEGARSVSAARLERAVRTELRQYRRRGQRPADLADAAFKMTVLLSENGFAHGQVDFRKEDARVVFVVDEGPRTFVGNVTFPGAEGIAEPRLRAAFKGAHSLRLEGRPMFVLSAVQGAAGNVAALYRRRGFHRVRVGPVQVRWDSARTTADVDVPVVEGKLYRVIEARAEGPMPQGLDGLMEAMVDKPFDLRVPFEAVARIRGRLLNQGHRQPIVRPDISVDDAKATVTIVIQIDPGPVHRLRTVTVSGEERTRKRFVRTRIPTEEGGAILERDLEKAREDLYSTNLFKRVSIRTPSVSSEEADIEVEIEEYLARSIGFKVGWASYELLRGAILYQDLNFSGRGQILTAEVNASLKGWGVEGSFRDKYLLGPRWDIAVGGGYEFREEPTFDRQSVHGALTFIHDLARFARPWPARPRALDLTLGYLYDAQRASNVTGPIPIAEQNDFVVSAGLSGQLDYDSLDDPLIPTSGQRARLALFWSSPTLGAELDYLEFELEFATHKTLGAGTVLVAGMRFQSRSPLDGSVTLPVQNRLFLGGADSVRSFRQDLLGPTDAQNQPLGGLTAAVLSIELRQRLTGNLYGAAFYDAGTVGASPWSFGTEPGQAIGVGLRYYLPVGPIRVDVGYNPGMLFGMTSRWAIHFAVGFSF